MAVPAAFIVVVLIWSTTPLAVKWSGEGPGFIFGAFSRMAFAVVLCLVIINAMRAKRPWHREAAGGHRLQERARHLYPYPRARHRRVGRGHGQCRLQVQAHAALRDLS